MCFAYFGKVILLVSNLAVQLQMGFQNDCAQGKSFIWDFKTGFSLLRTIKLFRGQQKTKCFHIKLHLLELQNLGPLTFSVLHTPLSMHTSNLPLKGDLLHIVLKVKILTTNQW